jgi:hypothetical protein
MIPVAQSSVLQGMMLAALAAVIGWLLLRTHRQLSGGKQDAGPVVRVSRPKQGEHGHHLDAPAEVLRWEVQMHETARELSAQLDSKLRSLRVLIAEADRAAARLEAAAASSSEEPGEAADADSRPATQAEALRASGMPDEAGGEGAGGALRPSARRDREEICTLADYGMAAAEIARRVGVPVGEVELILGLRERS